MLFQTTVLEIDLVLLCAAAHATETQMDKSIVKAFTLLELLANSDVPLGVTALADTAELGKSNVHRILQTLLELGYVEQGANAQYQPSLKTWEMGCRVMSRLSLRDVARGPMQILAELTKEAVHLSELHQGEVLYIDKIESSEPVRAYTQLGGRAPAHCTATGKAMLAFASDADIAAALLDASDHTPKTITSLDRFEIEAEHIRTNRYSLNRGEWRSDIIGLGAPIADQSGNVVAAIGLSAPASRVELSELETLAVRLIEHAERVSLSLGCSSRQWAELPTCPNRQAEDEAA